MRTGRSASGKQRAEAPRAGGRSPSRDDWREIMLSRLRAVIEEADPAAIEEMKWKKPSNPAGVPVWSHSGIVCIANVLKNSVRLTFPKGASLKDPSGLFNARLDSRSVRAVDFREGELVNARALTAIVRGSVALNTSKNRVR